MNGGLSFTLPRHSPDGWVRADLTETPGGHGLAVVFWSAVCSHCRRYDAYLNAWARRFSVDLAVVGCRAGESTTNLDAAVQERALTFPLFHDAEGHVAQAWGARQTPTVYLLDAGHAVVYRGAIDDFTYPDNPGHRPYLADAAQALLDGRPVPLASTAAFGCPTQSIYYDRKSLFTGGSGA